MLSGTEALSILSKWLSGNERCHKQSLPDGRKPWHCCMAQTGLESLDLVGAATCGLVKPFMS